MIVFFTRSPLLEIMILFVGACLIAAYVLLSLVKY